MDAQVATPPPQIPLERLRWHVGTQDVTCWLCHSALYKPGPEDRLCPRCVQALWQQTMLQATLQRRPTLADMPLAGRRRGRR